MLQLRGYQERSLDGLEGYLRLATQIGAKKAFIHHTDRPYHSVPQLPDLPYVCLRVPTGGGKTLMACHALGIAASEYLQADHAVCLWLVPSNTIREQTLAALRDRLHPYRQAVAAQFSGSVTVMDLTEALYVQRGTLSGETCVIVSTLAALRVEDTDGRKVYESSGALQHHFTGLSPELEDELERAEDGTIDYSLANVLRLRRPVVIMDEAHNARTRLSFDTLRRLKPSCIIEFTATPETTHKPEKGYFASNVLQHVSAAELKTEEMIKLPIRLQTRPEWKQVISDALQKQRDLERIAREEEKKTGEYIRPIVLLQAQPRSKEKETLTARVVKQCLLDDFKIPEDRIAIATGETREIDDVDLLTRDCPLRFIITVQALKEGWDCRFAYVLCSVATTRSPRAVEQILGRILRLPHGRRKQHDELNCSYAFVAFHPFMEAARSLKDALVDNGFERFEAEQFVAGTQREQGMLFDGPSLFQQIDEVVPETPDLSKLDEHLRQRVTYEEKSQTIHVVGIISEKEQKYLERCFSTPEGKQLARRIYDRSRGRVLGAASPSERGESLKVPQLAIRVGKQLELFEESHFLDSEWDLTDAAPNMGEDVFPSDVVTGEAGELDVTKAGKVEIGFPQKLHRQLSCLTAEPGWTVPALVNWLDRQIPHPDLTRTQATLFIHRVVTTLTEARGLSIEHLAGHKFRLRSAVATRIERHRREQLKRAFQKVLFSPDRAEINVSPELCFSYSADKYGPNWYYEGTFKLPKHYFPQIGELRSEGEEFECAAHIAQTEKVAYWVRNLENRPESSFWLQTSTDRFYPDFVAKLKDGRILVVEYKGEHLWSNEDSKEKHAVGELWADRSNGRCLFVMPRGMDLAAIDAAVR